MNNDVQFLYWLKVIVVILCISLREIKTQTQPYSITAFPGLGDFYLGLRTQNIGTEAQLLTTSTKWAVCTQIFRRNSELRRPPHALVHPLDYRDALENDERYSDIFYEIFEPMPPAVTMNVGDEFAAGSSSQYVYTNPTVNRQILVNGNEYTESVFTCLTIRQTAPGGRRSSARGDDRLIFKQFYVSHDLYNVNEVQDLNRINGRFVFSYNEQNKVVVHALAEEFAQPLRFTHFAELEQYYISKLGVRVEALNAEDDPICRLNLGQRLRLCNSLFKRYRWAALMVYVDPRCEKIQFSVINGATMFSEWMIYCRTQGTLRFNYRISRSYTDNEVFVYDDGARGLRLFDCYQNIGVVRDRPTFTVPLSFLIDERVNQQTGPSTLPAFPAADEGVNQQTGPSAIPAFPFLLDERVNQQIGPSTLPAFPVVERVDQQTGPSATPTSPFLIDERVNQQIGPSILPTLSVVERVDRQTGPSAIAASPFLIDERVDQQTGPSAIPASPKDERVNQQIGPSILPAFPVVERVDQQTGPSAIPASPKDERVNQQIGPSILPAFSVVERVDQQTGPSAIPASPFLIDERVDQQIATTSALSAFPADEKVNKQIGPSALPADERVDQQIGPSPLDERVNRETEPSVISAGPDVDERVDQQTDPSATQT